MTTRVLMLKKLAAAIPDTREVAVGVTGYLDDPVTPTARAMKGADKHGRVFVTLCLESRGRDDRRSYESGGIVTVFQRYTSDSDVVAQASNTQMAPQLFLGGAASVEDMKLLETLLTRGSAERVVPNVIGGTLRESFRLVEPSELRVVEDS